MIGGTLKGELASYLPLPPLVEEKTGFQTVPKKKSTGRHRDK